MKDGHKRLKFIHHTRQGVITGNN